MRRPRRFFLAMHGIEGDDVVRDMEFAEQLLRGGDFVGFFRDIDVCQDETGFDVEGVQHLGRLRSVKLSKLRLSVLPSIAMTRRAGSVMALHRPAACWRKICSTAGGSRPWRIYRIEVWAGARRQCRPKAAFNRRRCTLMKVTMER